MIRLFVGLELEARLQDTLQRLTGGIAGARWVRPPNFHLTLRFIGEVGHDRMDDIHDALTTVRAPGFDLTLAGAGHFGPLDHARMLWIGVARNKELVHLQAKIESALVRTGLPAEPRKFTPHVTVAKLKHASPAQIAHFVARHALLREEPHPVRHFTLFSSFLSHSGAIYTPEAHYPLPPPAWDGADDDAWNRDQAPENAPGADRAFSSNATAPFSMSSKA